MAPSCPKFATVLYSLHKSIQALEWPGWRGTGLPDSIPDNRSKFHADFFCPKCHHKFPFTIQEEADVFLAGTIG
jgi:hypothetical protein